MSKAANQRSRVTARGQPVPEFTIPRRIGQDGRAKAQGNRISELEEVTQRGLRPQMSNAQMSNAQMASDNRKSCHELRNVSCQEDKIMHLCSAEKTANIFAKTA